MTRGHASEERPPRIADRKKAGEATVAAPTQGNLPLELSSFVGRGREISEVERLLAGTRLLTITGTGGCGKTRLALRIAANLAERFEDGAWWVGLAPLADPALVPKSVASSLGVREQPGRSMTEALSAHLGTRELLLVLDNCEHLIESCAALVEALLIACPGLKVLATSREPLGIYGETSWSMPSLSLPAAHHRTPIQELVRSEAACLFIERATEARPDFALTERDGAAVVEVCRELEGIPLAIELAAARVKVLRVQQIAERLDDRLGLLAGGSRTAAPRQRALRTTIEWSYGLLRRLSVFAGGFTLEAAEEVCSGGRIERVEVLDLVSRLVDKSLVVPEMREAQVRYRLLETIRQYGEDKLQEAQESHAVRRRHAGFFLALAEDAEPEMAGPEQPAWLGRLVEEHDNLRASLGWLEQVGETEQGLCLASALLRFWWFRGHLAEGRARLEALLDLYPETPVSDEVRAKALHALGVLIYRHADDAAGDWQTARPRLEESLKICRRLGDERRTSAVLQDIARVMADLGGLETAHALLEESLEIGRRLNDRHGVALSLFQTGTLRFRTGELSRGDGSDYVDGGDGADNRIQGLAGNDTVLGSAGNDANVQGGSGDDKVSGGSGDDGTGPGVFGELTGDTGNNTVDGGLGDDEIDARASLPGEVEDIFGGPDNDTIRADDGEVDNIDCGTGNDTVTFDAGVDVVAGNC